MGDVVVIDKEPAVGAHASGRNSGVLHAGIYYSPGSLKARFCAEGNRLMTEFCRAKELDLVPTGKVIVPTAPGQVAELERLEGLAAAAGAEARLIDSDELARIEPHARHAEAALFSPNTATVRPQQILDALVADLGTTGRVAIRMGAPFRGLAGEGVADTETGRISFGHVVNTAGAHADRIARFFGVGGDYRILPFKGTYKKLRAERAHLVRGNIYPVPDARNPFLGVHLSRSVDGDVFAGPTAIPAFGRENYRGLGGMRREAGAILARDAVLLARNPAFRAAAFTEPRKYASRVVYKEARELVPDLAATDIQPSDKVGIRPQLVHWPTKKLEMDFVLLRERNSLHILNAISPAFTSSMAFAKHVVDTLLDREGARSAV